jgi:hypothetical protein
MKRARIIIKIHGETYYTKSITDDSADGSDCSSAKEMLTLWLWQDLDKIKFDLLDGETLILKSGAISQAVFLVEEIDE